jgi:hypothetical protein
MAWNDISGDSAQDLINWMHGRENDIANNMEDLGELKSIFREIFERNAGDPVEDALAF